MPQLYSSQISAQSAGGGNASINSRVSADAFGANIGGAVQALGSSVQQGANLLFDISKKRKAEEEANKTAMFDATDKILDLRNETGEDADGYAKKVRSTYLDEVENYVKDIQDDDVRSNVRDRLTAKLPSVSSTAAQYEFTVQAQNSQNETNDALSTLQNRIMTDPLRYDEFLAEGMNVIDAKSGITATLKQGMKQTWREDSAKRHFEGRLQQVKSKEGFDTLAAELAGEVDGTKDWAEEFSSVDMSSMLNKIGSSRKSFVDAIESNARSMLGKVEERLETNTTLVPDHEMARMQELAAQSDDPQIQRRAARATRNQELIKVTERLTPAAIRTQINSTNGSPKQAYPGLPPVVSSAVNKTSETFGISASYLGAMAHREYGQFFKKPKPRNEKYSPQPLNPDIDMTGIDPEILDAATLAGEAIGSPVNIVQSQSTNEGLSISTLGMDEQTLISLTGAMVDAGFTGFEEMDGVLHVSMQAQVPSTFGDKDGQFWGGWTNLSPSISKVLLEKGFAPGAKAEAVQRNPLRAPEPGIDFGKTTQIKDADGNPTSSALGVAQFTKGTWLRTVQDPAVAAVMGIEPGMSEEEILALRADPELSMLAAGALALSNSRQLQRATGRVPNDAELYMAHFLGAGGATTLINANRANPNTAAADLLPAAAKANRKVFYDGNRKKTVDEVYADISDDFSFAPSQVSFEDNQLRKKILANTEAALKSDPMSHAAKVGSHTIPDLFEEGGFEARGPAAMSVSDYYKIPMQDMKPFSEDEAQFIKKRIDESDADEVLSIMEQINGMGADVSTAALRQIDQYSPVFAHAADLKGVGMASAAADIIRGQKRIEDNPAIKEQIALRSQDYNDAFIAATGGALFDVPPKQRQAIQEAALAHYVQQGPIDTFDSKKFEKSVQAVLGGDDAREAVAEVNGFPTLIPQGIDANTFEDAIDRMSVEDWVYMSESGSPPRYADGMFIDPADIRDDIMLRSIGGGEYNLMLEDGQMLITDEFTPEGRAKTFVFKPDVERLQKIAKAPVGDTETRKHPLSGFLLGGL